MKTLEGIIIKKTPTKARDMICNILLRTGRVLTVYCYGGQGGGKHHKGTILELGHMIRIQVTPNKKYITASLASSRDWSLIWESDFIRKNINAFYYMCFLFEIVAKISLPHELDDDDQVVDHEGVFNVLSNALFYLDDNLQKTVEVDIRNHLALFMVKLFGQVGIIPDTEHCAYCHTDIKKVGAVFETGQGGFACVDCLSKKGEYLAGNDLMIRQIQDSSNIKNMILAVSSLAYKDYQRIENSSWEMNSMLFNHLCYQFHFGPSDFKSKSTLF